MATSTGNVNRIKVEHPAHFLALAAKVMRQILLDKARPRLAAKRGGGAICVDLDTVADVAAGETTDRTLIALDDPLEELARVDERRARVYIQCGSTSRMARSSLAKAANTITLSPDGTQFSVTATIPDYDTNNNLLTTACVTAKRF